MPELTNLELWNVIVIATGVLSVKLCEVARRKEQARQHVNEIRMGLIIGIYWDAQLAMLCGISTLSLLLAPLIGTLGAFIFAGLCVALLSAGPPLGRKLVLAFSTPRVQRRRRTRRYHAAGTYRPADVRRSNRATI